jgi:hypothetical protein
VDSVCPVTRPKLLQPASSSGRVRAVDLVIQNETKAKTRLCAEHLLISLNLHFLLQPKPTNKSGLHPPSGLLTGAVSLLLKSTDEYKFVTSSSRDGHFLLYTAGRFKKQNMAYARSHGMAIISWSARSFVPVG